MRDIPILWYQCSGKFPIWDFCYSAVFGAEQNGTKHKPFEDVDQIDGNPYNIIVGSVEECSKWLRINGFEVPGEINIAPSIGRTWFSKQDFLNEVDVFEYPMFIKPKGVIKAFTGTVVKDVDDAKMVLNGYEDDIWVYDNVVDLISEWRCYIHKGKLVKVCNYAGDPNIYPSPYNIEDYIRYANQVVKHTAYTIDVGVKFGEIPLTKTSQFTILIEGNDMWAIGNYGLEPNDYYQMIKDRWYQITGLIK